jgi:hypothetical protein
LASISDIEPIYNIESVKSLDNIQPQSTDWKRFASNKNQQKTQQKPQTNQNGSQKQNVVQSVIHPMLNLPPLSFLMLFNQFKTQ